MGFRINTNIAAMNAHRNATQTNMGLDKSLASLSSGLRINKAADDASGMTIADSLKSQALGLGQAIANANDGVSVVQTADGALDEYIKIINTVRTKAIQAASDGQSADSRAAIQSDIDRLLEEAQNIATTTSFNGQQLLDGTFVDKAFHIGAYANETVNFSVGNAQTDAVGGLNNAVNNGQFLSGVSGITDTTSGIKVLDNGSYGLQSILTINGTDVTAEMNETYPTSLFDAKSVAQAISDTTDVHATATNAYITSGTVAAVELSGATGTNYIKINGVDVGTVSVSDDDANRNLTTAINSISDLTGVTASVDADGVMTLTAEDGRNISVEVGGTATEIGLADNTTTVTLSQSSFTSSASVAVTLNAGELVINGVDMAGTYGSAGVADSARKALEAAIQEIEGLEDSTISSVSGAITLTTNTGIDINVAENGDEVSAAADTTGIFNSAKQGTVTMYSDKAINIGTEYNDVLFDNVLGFEQETIRTNEGDDRLSTIDVTTRRSAELAIMISDAALKSLDATRSDIGSVQNQLESTIRNISVTQVNVTAAESQIRDVDFAAESANFAKLNILAQSGSYAMSQANAVQQNVLRLLQ